MTRKITGREIRAALARIAGEPEPEEPEGPLHCSFCGRSQTEVAKLIAGPAVYICNECIARCVEILDEEGITLRPKP